MRCIKQIVLDTGHGDETMGKSSHCVQGENDCVTVDLANQRIRGHLEFTTCNAGESSSTTLSRLIILYTMHNVRIVYYDGAYVCHNHVAIWRRSLESTREQ